MLKEAQVHIRGLQKKLKDAQKKISEFGTMRHQALDEYSATQYMPYEMETNSVRETNHSSLSQLEQAREQAKEAHAERQGDMA